MTWGTAEWWTEPRVETLRQMVNDGASCGLIADALGTTRNAVLGKKKRLGLCTGRAPLIAKSGTRRPRPKKNAAAFNRFVERVDSGEPIIKQADEPVDLAPAVVDSAIPESQRCSLLELTPITCRWPVGDPRSPGFFFCGGRVWIAGAPYCGHHARMALP